MINPLQVYGQGLLGRDGHLSARFEDGTSMRLALNRYRSPAEAIEEELLETLHGPVLDVGCGPGRHLHALARRGVFALGVDLSPVAVELARGGGGHAIVASIFDELPGAGTWRSALLLDGNIGIGGAPERLLGRVHALLSDRGELVVELDPSATNTIRSRARLETTQGPSGWFPWARVAVTDIEMLADQTGFEIQRERRRDDRWFAQLVRS